MGVRVVIPKETLKRLHACQAAYEDLYWSESEQARIFPDWDDAVQTYYIPMGVVGLDRLGWLVRHKLVPMTREQLAALKKARSGGSNG
jgi:hypothetical protein